MEFRSNSNFTSRKVLFDLGYSGQEGSSIPSLLKRASMSERKEDRSLEYNLATVGGAGVGEWGWRISDL